jgi:RNA methyltransferase, TrmH family
VGRRSARDADRVFVVEGTKLLAEALAATAPIEGVYVAEGTDDPAVDEAAAAGIRIHELGAGVIERVADTTTPQPVMAIVPYVDVALEKVQNASLLVVCVDLRDPGNAGTVLRSAEAAGAGGVICADGTVDLFNPKTVRASAGSLFHVPVIRGGDALEVLDQVGRWGLQRLATVPRHGTAYTDIDLTRPTAFVLGNEAGGLPSGLDAHMDIEVTIPMAGRTESLNVGMAAAVLCFEAMRQRTQP